MCLISYSAYCQEGLLRYIDLENAVILSDGRLQDRSQIYPTAITGGEPKSFISSDCFSGSKSLMFTTPAAQSTQRFEYKLCDYNQPDALNFANERYVGFAVKIPETFDTLKGSVIFFQAWQGYPWGPPLMLKMTSGGNPYRVRLTIRNTSTGPDSVNPDEQLWTEYMYKNQWYTFVVGMKPRVYGDSSRVQLWMNSKLVLDWNGNIGYDPATFTTDVPYPSLCLKFGIYQVSANTSHTLLFDEIRYSSDYMHAVPEQSVSAVNPEEHLPDDFILYQNYPNPFNSATSIFFNLPEPGMVRLSIFNLLGQQITELKNEYMKAGMHSVNWAVPVFIVSGSYFYRIEAGGHVATKKLLLIK